MTLQELVEAGDVNRVRAAVAAGADVNHSFPESDECPLSTAAETGQLEMVWLLLELGADPNIRETVTPPLCAAAYSGSLDSVIAILDAGGEVDVKDEDGSTALMIAASRGDTEIVEELLKRGANPKLKDRYGNTSLASATKNNHSEVCNVLIPLSTPREREKATIRLELQAQEVQEKDVLSFFHAIIRGNFEEVRSIVQQECPPDAVDSNGTSALMWAANKNHTEIVRWLLEKGADVNRKSAYGESPLSYAAMGCHPEMYDYLYPLTDKKLRKRAERIKQNQIDIGNWPLAK